MTDGSMGMQNQALGVAEALGSATISIKKIRLRQPWKTLSPYIRLLKRHCLHKDSDPLLPPWPDLVIACGRQSILPALFIKEESKRHTKVIYIQNPKISSKYFDIVLCPEHDKFEGPNVIKMITAPHRITEDYLKNGYEEFSETFSGYSGPRYSILLGGPTKSFSFTKSIAEKMAQDFLALQKNDNASLLISPSRRTPLEIIQVFKTLFSGNPNIYFWDQTSKNPYFGLLAWGDALLITSDSVSMISEACSTTKPVFIVRLPGENMRFTKFYNSFLKMGRVQWFEGHAFCEKMPSFNEMSEVVSKIKEKFEL